MIKLLIVDDHELVRTGIIRMLSDATDLKVVGQAGSGEEALDLARSLSPDIILMDVRMPGIGGLEATRKLTQRHPEIKVIAVTACEDDPFPSRLMQAGARGYLTKGTDMQEMLLAIRQVAAGNYYLNPYIAQQMALQPLTGSGQVNPFQSLSEREMQISLMIAQGHKIQNIADMLSLSPKTVNTYRYRIFEKLGLENDVELALYAVRHGLIDAEKI